MIQLKLASTSKRFLGDFITPVGAFEILRSDSTLSVLLESALSTRDNGRYSFVAIHPLALFSYDDESSCLELPSGKTLLKDNPFNVLQDIRKQTFCRHLDKIESGEPFSDPAWIGFMGYDMIRCIENIPNKNPKELNIPDAQLFIPSLTLVFDHYNQTMTMRFFGVDDDRFETMAEKAFESTLAKLVSTNVSVAQSFERETGNVDENFVSPFSEESYLEAVKKGVGYIYEGDIFQVVLSRRLEYPFKGDDLQLYRRLRSINPSPYLYCLSMGDYSIVGSSPETLVRNRGGNVTIRPIAGSSPRGKDADEDRLLEEELLNDPKENAEHMMLVDLARNDIGRVCEAHSVKPTSLRKIENYSHIKHIVSNVEGKLAQGYDSMDLVRATFPAGTLSGAPKIRAMEIIDELEPTRRYIYGGAVLYWELNDNLDSCIIIRSALLKDGKVYIQSGGGIVADSVPEKELMESKKKAGAVVQAIRNTQDKI